MKLFLSLIFILYSFSLIAADNTSTTTQGIKMRDKLNGKMDLNINEAQVTNDESKDKSISKKEYDEKRKEITERLKGNPKLNTTPSKCDPKDDACLKNEYREQKKAVEQHLKG